jgi:hypothetical protein
MDVDDCIPSCADGKRTRYRATVTLTRLTRYRGKRGYADMVIAAPSSPFKPERFRTSLIPG